MKKLFRASRPTVDPLPPPPPPVTTDTASSTPPHSHSPGPPPLQHQIPTKKGMPGMPGMANLASMMDPDPRRRHQPSQGSVTPFPLGVGQQQPPPQSLPQSPSQSLHQPHSPPPMMQPHGRRGPPTLMEMRQDEATRRVSASSASSNPSAAWPVPIPTQPPHPPPELPQPPIQVSSQPPQFYLPPGARPPSPQFRPVTPPNRAARISQTSLAGVPLGSSVGVVGFDNDGYASGRSRGYSSASQSARGSDVESSSHHASHPHYHAHSLSHPGAAAPIPAPAASPPVPSKISKSPIPTRSPLAYEQQPSSGYTASPNVVPGPTLHSVSPPVPQVMPNPWQPMANGPPPAAMQSMSAPFSNLTVTDVDDMVVVNQQQPKEKRRFWGMNWGGERKGRSREMLRPDDDESVRPSMDEWRDDSAFGDDERSRNVEPRANWLNRSFNNLNIAAGPEPARPADIPPSAPQLSPGAANDVTTAIRMLCARPDPSVAAILDVCERVNHSDSPDSVAKEAARCIRKEIKGGNEAERRTAARVWLIMMRNVSTKGFRQQASSKKFLQSLEPILLAPPGRPLVSTSTHKLFVDILAGLAYQYGTEKGCEALVELWKRVKLPQESEFGIPLAADHKLYSPELMSPPPNSVAFPLAAPSPPVSRGASRSPSEPFTRAQSPGMYGPGYARLPDHGEDMRRLREEVNAAREAARVLQDALLYTRPEELEHKTVIREFYPKCFLAHESLTAQMEWAQSEAARSRQREDSLDSSETPAFQMDNAGNVIPTTTTEEQALAELFEVHGMLTEALRMHDELEVMAADDREMREASERSRKETRMDRYALAPEPHQASTSRAASPVPPPRTDAPPLAQPPLSTDSHSQSHSHTHLRASSAAGMPFDGRSRTPSPDRVHPPPRVSASPSRANSPLGLGRVRVPGPRPLPNPFRSAAAASNQSLHSSAGAARGPQAGVESGRDANAPSRGGSGSTNDGSGSGVGADADGEEEKEDQDKVPAKPSRKALGKRRAVVDEDNIFDPNDMFGLPRASPPPRDSTDSDDSLTADDVYFARPVKYAYDAYQEKIEAEAKAAASGGVGGGGAGSGQVGGGSGAGAVGLGGGGVGGVGAGAGEAGGAGGTGVTADGKLIEVAAR